MIRNNLLLALRLIFKHRNISIINLLGLSISMACVLFIMLWVQHELSYDRFHPDYKQVYRVEENQYYSNPDPYHVNVTPHPSGPVWKEEIPEITQQCRIAYSGGILLRHDDTKFYENDVVATDSSFFRIFGFQLILGDTGAILNQPNTLVLSRDIAQKYFGTHEALGKTLKVNDQDIYTVTGVMENPPRNSILSANVLLPWSFRQSQQFYSDSWDNNSIFTYIKTIPDIADTTVNNKITSVTNVHKEENTITFEINPIHRIHLHSYFGFGKSPGAIMYVWIFSAVAVFVLIIACINFMNMSTAKSSLRVKEIGLRKVNGASRNSLIRQYLSESILQTFVSVVISFLLVILLLNKFNDISGKDLTYGTLLDFKFLMGLFLVVIFTGLMAGLYPAFYLSSFSPVRAIKEQNDSRRGTGLLRKVLVVFQFSISILLIAGSLIISRQLNYMQNADLGFNKEHLLNIPLRAGLGEHYETLKEEFLKDPRIEYVSASMQEAFNIGSNSSGISWPGKDPENEILVSFSGVDHQFTNAMGIELLSGRGFSNEYLGDMFQDTTANFIINETLAGIINQEDIVGMDLMFMGIHGTIVGIMEDYHFKPLRNEVEPLAIIPLPSSYLTNMIIRLKSEDIGQALEAMEETWNSKVSQYPFSYSFVDEEIDKMYRSEQRMSRLIGVFAAVAIVIACMGLFALSSFTAERRTREIGIRKTFGASEQNIVIMMITDTAKLIAISLLIGLIGVWYIADLWLQDFHYRIDLNPDIFIWSAMGTVLISILTISYQAFRSARLNPVLALRYE